MRRATLAIAFGLTFAVCALAQEPTQTQAVEESDPWIWWKWLNFAILAGGFGYLIAKKVPAMFRARSTEIQQALDEAANAKRDAESRAAAIQTRLAGLQNEIENLRAAAQKDLAAEGERIRRETERLLQRVQEQSAQEIALIARGARNGLRAYAAELAVDLAEQQIRSRMTPQTQDALAEGFLHDLSRSAPA